jgi:hypothetical protein
MTTTTTPLKQLLGEAGAGMDQSHGTTRLYDVIKKMVECAPPFLTVRQDPTVGIPVAGVVPATGRYDIELKVNVVDAGSAGQTDVEATLNTTTIAGSEVTIGNAAANDTTASAVVEDVELTEGDVVAIEVTAADASATLGTYSLFLRPIKVE